MRVVSISARLQHLRIALKAGRRAHHLPAGDRHQRGEHCQQLHYS